MGLDELKVSDVAMVVAEAQNSYYMYDTWWNEEGIDHELQFIPMGKHRRHRRRSVPVLVCGRKRELRKWESDDEAVGHYLNIVDSDYYVTGFADGAANYTDYRAQNFFADSRLSSKKEQNNQTLHRHHLYVRRVQVASRRLHTMAIRPRVGEDGRREGRRIRQGSATHVSGIVADTAGNPIAGVAVTLSGPKTLTATTDEDSSFDLDAGDGGWALTVTADGYADGT